MSSLQLPLTNKLSEGTVRQRSYKTLITQFGDGYSQRAPDGLNATRDTWDIVYADLTAANRSSILTFTDAIGNWDFFLWTARGDSTQKKWRITTEIKESCIAGHIYSISFTCEQVFDL